MAHEMDGFLSLNKGSGLTSHDVVTRARRVLGMKKIGHAGTLDPMATGVLVLCLGKATRLVDFVGGARKTYVAEVAFGRTTDTQDATGRTLTVRDASGVAEDTVLALLPRFRGEILQIPPMVSARHHQGERLYNLARRGETVEREARSVTIYRLDLRAFRPGPEPVAVLEVECSAGTYIRALAHDLGEAAGCGALMASLDRTRVGRFTKEQSLTLEELAEVRERGELERHLTPMLSVVAHLPRRDLSPAEAAAVAQGNRLPVDDRADPDLYGALWGTRAGQATVLLVSPSGELAALARPQRDPISSRLYLKPTKVFAAPPVSNVRS